jgi:hypothetical protein
MAFTATVVRLTQASTGYEDEMGTAATSKGSAELGSVLQKNLGATGTRRPVGPK